MLLREPTGAHASARDWIASLPGADNADPLAAALAIDAQMALPDDMLHYFDRGSMAHSLEVRVPFLDHPLVEKVASIPTNLKLHGSTTKYVLREAARGIVPDRIIDKPKIGFFNAGVSSWMSATLERDADLLLPGNPAYAEHLERRGVEQLLNAQLRAPTARRAQLLLSILLLEVWLVTYLPRALGKRPSSYERAATA